MAKFWIDYSTSVLIEAETAEEAKRIFWEENYEALDYADTEIYCVEREEDEDD